MGDSRFLYETKDNEDLQLWTIYLEFAKAKAIYDDFTNNYGKVCFPLSNQNEYYDTQFKYDVKIEVRLFINFRIVRESEHYKQIRILKKAIRNQF